MSVKMECKNKIAAFYQSFIGFKSLLYKAKEARPKYVDPGRPKPEDMLYQTEIDQAKSALNTDFGRIEKYINIFTGQALSPYKSAIKHNLYALQEVDEAIADLEYIQGCLDTMTDEEFNEKMGFNKLALNLPSKGLEMYYHILVQTKEDKSLYEADKLSLEEIIHAVMIPFRKKEEIQFDGYFLSPGDIRRIVIKKSEKTIGEVIRELYRAQEIRNAHSSVPIIQAYSKTSAFNSSYTHDITNEAWVQAERLLEKKDEEKSTADKGLKNNKVFVVHGHDNEAKIEVARFLEKIKLEPIILHEQANMGNTLIEKIEHYSNVGFGIVLYTPCDIGGRADSKKLKDLKNRARQNVVLEHGYLLHRLGRKNVCALVKGKLEVPSDMDGIVYISFDGDGAWYRKLAKELKAAGYRINSDLLLEA